MRKHGKIDANQPAIVEALRKAGASVQSMANIGNGCPDLLCGFRGRWWVFEVKVGMGRLTPDEKAWIESAQGTTVVVRSVEDALIAIGAI